MATRLTANVITATILFNMTDSFSCTSIIAALVAALDFPLNTLLAVAYLQACRATVWRTSRAGKGRRDRRTAHVHSARRRVAGGYHATL